jgi:hypothetical protein
LKPFLPRAEDNLEKFGLQSGNDSYTNHWYSYDEHRRLRDERVDARPGGA